MQQPNGTHPCSPLIQPVCTRMAASVVATLKCLLTCWQTTSPEPLCSTLRPLPDMLQMPHHPSAKDKCLTSQGAARPAPGRHPFQSVSVWNFLLITFLDLSLTFSLGLFRIFKSSLWKLGRMRQKTGKKQSSLVLLIQMMRVRSFLNMSDRYDE